MADPTYDFSSMFGDAVNWAQQNPQLAGAGIGALGTLIDPAQATTTTQQQNISMTT